MDSAWWGPMLKLPDESRGRLLTFERALPGISPRTLSERLRALEHERFIVKHSAARRVEYELTEKGKALLPGMREIAQRIFEDAQDGLSADERTVLLKGLEQLCNNLSRRPSEPVLEDSQRLRVVS